MRHFCEEDGCYIDEYCNFKRACRHGYKDQNIVVTSDHIIFKGRSLHVVKRLFKYLDFKDIDFVVSCNSKGKYNEFTDKIDVPYNFPDLLKDKSSTPRYSTPR